MPKGASFLFAGTSHAQFLSHALGLFDLLQMLVGVGVRGSEGIVALNVKVRRITLELIVH